LIPKKAKLKLHNITNSPAVTYACETWVLKESLRLKFLIFERKILREIFGPTKEADNT
jgi:hypothetical protein